MKSLRVMVKLMLTALILSANASVIGLFYQVFVAGQYYVTAGFFLNTLICFLLIVSLMIGFGTILAIWQVSSSGSGRGGAGALLLCLLAAPATQGCDYAQANVQTLVTSDCGVSWDLIQAGASVPKRIGPCAYKVTVPDYPMSGDTRFKASFQDRVLATIEVSYEYTISDAKTFIGEAKYLGKSNTASDDSSNASSAYETAENVVIDKRIREAAAERLLSEDIVDFSQAEFEDELLEAANESLKSKGVRLNFLSVVPTPEEQTRLAIDMMTAMKIYESRELGELGRAVAAARAGATQININQASTPTPPQAQ